MPYYIKALAVFVVALIGLRLMGKKAVGQMSNYDLAMVIILTTVLSEPLVTKELYTALYGSLLLVILYLTSAFVMLKWPLVRRLVLPQPVTLLFRGKLDEGALAKAKLTLDEFAASIRQNGYTGPHEIEWAVMELDGQISFIPKASARPVSPPDMGLAPANPTLPIRLVSDGIPDAGGLRLIGQEESWIRNLVAAQRIEMRDLFWAMIDEKSDLWLYMTRPSRMLLLPGVLRLDPQVFDRPFPH